MSEAVELIEPPRRRRRTHCAHGHELVEANIYRRPSRPNEIECRLCRLAERDRRPPRKPRSSPNPNGRPSHKPTDELRLVVRNMASMGLRQDQIARAIGVGSETTLHKYYAEEIAKGTIAVHAAVGATFVRKCLGGDPSDPDHPPDWRKADTAALLHYMRSRLGWVEAGSDNDNVGGLRLLPLGKDFKNI